MKYLLYILILFCTFSAHAQIITTFAGNGAVGANGDGGDATAAAIGYPDGCAFDSKGNFYFTQVSPDRVRKVTPSGIISTIAGTGMSSGYNGDGIPATDAQLYFPGSIVFDSQDNIYIADAGNGRIRKIDATTGIISTILGGAISGFSGDGGPASAASISGVADIWFDSRYNLYVSDGGNERVRKINTSGIITTVAGNGTAGWGGDGGMATAATIQSINGICTDTIGNLYLAQTNDARVRKVDVTGRITTVAGNGSMGPTGDGGPSTAATLDPVRLVCDKAGNLFISCYSNNNIRKIDNAGIIHTIAGTGISGFSGDDSIATDAKLHISFGLAFDTCGNLYFADKDNSRIRKVAFNPLCLDNLVVGSVKDATMSIYPNPAYEVVNVDNLKAAASYRLLNLVGVVQQQGSLKEGNNSISVASLPQGVYLLELTSLSFGEGRGEVKTVTKIVKQ